MPAMNILPLAPPSSGEFSDPSGPLQAEVEAAAGGGGANDGGGVLSDGAVRVRGGGGGQGGFLPGNDDDDDDDDDGRASSGDDAARLSPPVVGGGIGGGGGGGRAEEEEDDDASIHLLDEVDAGVDIDVGMGVDDDVHRAGSTDARDDNSRSHVTSGTAETASASAAQAQAKIKVKDDEDERKEADYTTEAGARAAVFQLVQHQQGQTPTQLQLFGQGQRQGQGQGQEEKELTNSATSTSSLLGSRTTATIGGGTCSVTESILAGIAGHANADANADAGNNRDAHSNAHSSHNSSGSSFAQDHQHHHHHQQQQHRPSFHDSLGSLGMSTLDLQTRLGGPPTPELPGTASLSELPDQMMLMVPTGGGDGGNGEGMANKRQRTDYTSYGSAGAGRGAAAAAAAAASVGAARTSSRSMPNLAGFEPACANASRKMMPSPSPSSSYNVTSDVTFPKSSSSRKGSAKTKSSAKGPAKGSAKTKKALPTIASSSDRLIRTPNPSDVLFGRGGGTNVHVGNKIFRDLINAHRRSYLKARKNDKPHITQRILNEIHDRHGGRFLKKAPAAAAGGTSSGTSSSRKKSDDDAERNGSDVHDSVVGTGWYEVDDMTAKEKISQALRQRAPELKKLIFKNQFGNEEIDYGQGNVVPVIFHPNPAENAYLRSLSVGLFSGGTEQVGQSHHDIEEAAKRRQMQQVGSDQPEAQARTQSQTPMPSAEQQQMLAQMRQVQMHLDQTAAVGQQQGLVAGDVFTAPLNDTVAVSNAQKQEQQQQQQQQQSPFAATRNDARSCGGSSSSTPTPATATTLGAGTGAAPVVPLQPNNATSLVQGLEAAAFEPIPYSGMDFAMLTQEQERKIKLIEIQRLRLQKQQLELQIAQQQQMNKATMAGLAPMPAALDVFGAGAGGAFPFGNIMAKGDAQLAQNETEGASPPSSLLSAMASSQRKLSGSNGGSPPMALAPADGTGGTTPQYNPFGSMQA